MAKTQFLCSYWALQSANNYVSYLEYYVHFEICEQCLFMFILQQIILSSCHLDINSLKSYAAINKYNMSKFQVYYCIQLLNHYSTNSLPGNKQYNSTDWGWKGSLDLAWSFVLQSHWRMFKNVTRLISSLIFTQIELQKGYRCKSDMPLFLN